MDQKSRSDSQLDRRDFFKTAGLGAAGLAAAAAQPAAAAPRTEKEKLARIASNTWPLRYIFKSRTGFGNNPRIQEQKKKYGEITMLDFPQFTKDTFPGVTHMDLFSGLFGDVTDDSMYVKTPLMVGAATRTSTRSSTLPARRARSGWSKLAAKMAATGTQCQHISNNAPRDICELDAEQRKAGVAVAKKWLDGAKILGAKSMRVNSGGPRILPLPGDELGRLPQERRPGQVSVEAASNRSRRWRITAARWESKVTLENHWGLTANPINIRIIVDEVGSPFCEASPDFCNWEHEYLMYNGLKALAPYAHTNVHAKYWNRWKDNDVKRSVKIMLDAGFEGTFALEYEDGPWDGVEGAKYLYKEVLAAL